MKVAHIKQKKNIIIISVLAISMVELFLGMAMSLTVSAVPNDKLKKTIAFLQGNQYVGMSVESCEEQLGEKGIYWSENQVALGAGSYRYQKQGDYILLLHLNPEGKVIYAELKEVW